MVGRSKYYFIQNAVQVAIDCSDPVYTDKKWIAFILNQILQNSLKYRRETGARIRIYTEKEKRGVRLTVEDNGIGIKAEELPRIFEKNFTGTNGRNHERSTGMGLYLCSASESARSQRNMPARRWCWNFRSVRIFGRRAIECPPPCLYLIRHSLPLKAIPY